MSRHLLMLSGDRDVAAGRRGPFHDTLAGLATAFARVDVLTPPDPAAAARTVHGHVHVHPARGPRTLRALWSIRQARALARTRRYHLIVSHDYGIFANGVAAWWLSRRWRVPFVSEIHHVPAHPRRAQWWEPGVKLAYRLYVRGVAAQARAIRVVNRTEVPDLLARWGVPRDKILVLPSAYIDRETFAPRPTDRRYTLGFVGRLVANKNLNYLATLIETAARQRPEARFIVIGRGPGADGLQRRLQAARLTDRVERCGWVDGPRELAGVYRQMDALVCTSSSEGGPRVCLEAMACGVPVFSTPVGLMPETLDSGRNGWLLPWDEAAGAALLRRVLADGAQLRRAGEAARAATAPFEKSRVLGAYVQAYRQLADEQPA